MYNTWNCDTDSTFYKIRQHADVMMWNVYEYDHLTLPYFE